MLRFELLLSRVGEEDDFDAPLNVVVAEFPGKPVMPVATLASKALHIEAGLSGLVPVRAKLI